MKNVLSLVTSALLICLTLASCGKRSKMALREELLVPLPARPVDQLSCAVRPLSEDLRIPVNAQGTRIGDPVPVQFEIIVYKNGVPIPTQVVSVDYPEAATPISGEESSFAIGTSGEHAFTFQVVDPQDPNSKGSCTAMISAEVEPVSRGVVSIQAGGSEEGVTVPHGGKVLISWISQFTDNCSITIDGAPTAYSGKVGSFDSTPLTAEGQSPDVRLFSAFCTGPGGNVTDSVAVGINPPPTALIGANGSPLPIEVNLGAPVELSWSSTYAQACGLSANGLSLNLSGLSGTTVIPALSTPTIFEITCTDTINIVKSSIAVGVKAPTAAIQASANPIEVGSPVTISWSSENAQDCSLLKSGTATGQTGKSGSLTVSDLTADTVFKVVCSGYGNNQVSKELTVDVRCTAGGFTVTAGEDQRQQQNVQCDGYLNVSIRDDDAAVSVFRDGTHRVVYLCDEYDGGWGLGGAQSCRPLDEDEVFVCNPDNNAYLGGGDDDNCNSVSAIPIPVKRGDVVHLFGGESDGITVRYTVQDNR